MSKLARVLLLVSLCPSALVLYAPESSAQVRAGVLDGHAVPRPQQRSLSTGGGNTIDFDDVESPCGFLQTQPLSDEYAAQGVRFEGPAEGDGGARLDECSNFFVSGYSSPNFLAFNVDADYPTGGHARGPESIRFDAPVQAVSVLAGSANAGNITLECFDAGGSSLGSDGRLGGNLLQPLAVAAPGIVRCEISFTGTWLVLDDLSWVPSCVLLDFETEDDFVTALVNGQHLDTEFGALVSLSSSGPNAGLAVFDSTPGGPNDPSQDPDLLVGSGNVLILQTENLPPDGSDVFPRPNDDEDGGTIAFDFAGEVELGSVRLIDVDAGDGDASVVLFDAAGGTRTYHVPSDWTGDLALGQLGERTLGLFTLAPQPGFGSVATATETPGFTPSRVVRLEITLAGSGAVDDLVFCAPAQARASATPRNGSGVNPMLLATDSAPVLGTTWTASLDCSALPGGLAVLEIRTRAASGTLTPFGEILARGVLVHRATRAAAGVPSVLGMPIPSDLSLAGLRLHAQGSCSGPASTGGRIRGARLAYTNAIDLVVGL